MIGQNEKGHFFKNEQKPESLIEITENARGRDQEPSGYLKGNNKGA